MRTTASMVMVALLTVGCASEAPVPASTSTPTAEPSPVRAASMAISADWLNGTLSVVDLDALAAPGGTLEAALVRRIELALPGEQGPLTLSITPDGRKAVVLLSQGVMAFVGDRIGIDTDSLPAAGSGVVVLDLETWEVIGQFPTDTLPIMAAIDPRSGRVFVSLFGGRDINGSVAVYDLESLEEVERVEVAPFVEGLAVNDSGTRGAVIGAADGLYLFDPADLAGTLSEAPLRLADDSSGVAFIAGTDRLVVANSRNPSNYVIIDASDLDAPVVIDEGSAVDAVPFMITAVPGRQEVVMPLAGDGTMRLLHLDVSEIPARTLHEIEVSDIQTFPQAVTVDQAGRYAFIGAAASRELLIFDLTSGGVERRRWLDELGPTAMAVVPK